MTTSTARAPAAIPTAIPTAIASTIPAASPAVRLTRRGRALRSLVLGLVLLAAVLVATVVWVPSVVATSSSGHPVPVQTVTVQPGQTLWDIAIGSGLGGDTRDVVHQIQDLNALSDPGDLQVGQSVVVPLR